MAKGKDDDLGKALSETADEVRAALTEILESADSAAVSRRAEALVALNLIAAKLAAIKKRIGRKPAQ